MIDLGSECTLMKEKFAKKLNLHINKTYKALIGFNNSVTEPIGMSHAVLKIDDIVRNVAELIVKNHELAYDVIVGRDILSNSGLQASIDESSLTFSESPNLFNLSEDRPTYTVNLVNSKSRRLVALEDLVHSLPDENIQEGLLSLLNEHRSAIALDISEVGHTNITEMKIKLKRDETVYYRPYRMSISEREILKKILAELEACHIIRESSSSFASPVILVRKNNGEYRLCIDHRALNKLIVRDLYPLPLIEDQIDRLGGKKFFTSLDLRSGFYQIPMSEESIELTAFITPDGQYEFLRMPFGLVNSPSVFQRAIHKALRKLLPLGFLLIYIDDLLIAANSIEEMFNALELVLKTLGESGFTLNLSKCKFFRTNIDYLGREISAEGVKSGEKKIIAIRDAKPPKNPKELRSFLGLGNHFRKFVKNYATIVLPLTKLTRKDVPWQWGVEEHEAFGRIKSCLIERPILAIFDPNLPSEVHTDASSLGVGAILMQGTGPNKRVVAYYSRKTDAYESKLHS